MKKKLFLSLLLISSVFYAQEGSLDVTLDPGTGFGARPEKLLNLANDKIFVVGDFQNYKGISAHSMVALNTDGSIDTSFNIGTPFLNAGGSGYLATAELQTDGKIIIGGAMSSYNGVNVGHVVRLNADGSQDTNFTLGANVSYVKDIVVQTDGKIIVGGNSDRLVRLMPDGSADTTFNIGTGFDGQIWCLALQPDGKILVGGNFNLFDGATYNHFVRLNTDGSVDTTFNTGTGFAISQIHRATISRIAVQPDGKIFVGGRFITYNGTPAVGLIRLNSDGTPDNTFVTGTGIKDNTPLVGEVKDILIQPNGKILVAGNFNKYNDEPHKNIVRLNDDGSVDTTIDFKDGFSAVVLDIELDSTGNILAVGEFFSFDNQPVARLARIVNTTAMSTKDFIKNAEIKLYPNPVDDVLNIEFDDEVLECVIYDNVGKKVMNCVGCNSLNVEKLSEGVYFLKIKTREGYLSGKFVKK